MVERVNRSIQYNVDSGVLYTPEFTAQAEFTSGWEQVPDAKPGVHCITFCLKGVSETQRDGALVRIPAGVRTPVQQIASDHTFWEVALLGDPTLLTVSPEGRYSLGSRNSTLTRGWSMVWVADPDCEALVLEYEKPAFKSAKLLTVPKDISIYNNRLYPAEFWRDISFFDARK